MFIKPFSSLKIPNTTSSKRVVTRSQTEKREIEINKLPNKPDPWTNSFYGFSLRADEITTVGKYNQDLSDSTGEVLFLSSPNKLQNLGLKETASLWVQQADLLKKALESNSTDEWKGDTKVVVENRGEQALKKHFEKIQGETGWEALERIFFKGNNAKENLNLALGILDFYIDTAKQVNKEFSIKLVNEQTVLISKDANNNDLYTLKFSDSNQTINVDSSDSRLSELCATVLEREIVSFGKDGNPRYWSQYSINKDLLENDLVQFINQIKKAGINNLSAVLNLALLPQNAQTKRSLQGRFRELLFGELLLEEITPKTLLTALKTLETEGITLPEQVYQTLLSQPRKPHTKRVVDKNKIPVGFTKVRYNGGSVNNITNKEEDKEQINHDKSYPNQTTVVTGEQLRGLREEMPIPPITRSKTKTIESEKLTTITPILKQKGEKLPVPAETKITSESDIETEKQSALVMGSQAIEETITSEKLKIESIEDSSLRETLKNIKQHQILNNINSLDLTPIKEEEKPQLKEAIKLLIELIERGDLATKVHNPDLESLITDQDFYNLYAKGQAQLIRDCFVNQEELAKTWALTNNLEVQQLARTVTAHLTGENRKLISREEALIILNHLLSEETAKKTLLQKLNTTLDKLNEQSKEAENVSKSQVPTPTTTEPVKRKTPEQVRQTIKEQLENPKLGRGGIEGLLSLISSLPKEKQAQLNDLKERLEAKKAELLEAKKDSSSIKTQTVTGKAEKADVFKYMTEVGKTLVKQSLSSQEFNLGVEKETLKYLQQYTLEQLQQMKKAELPDLGSAELPDLGNTKKNRGLEGLKILVEKQKELLDELIESAISIKQQNKKATQESNEIIKEAVNTMMQSMGNPTGLKSFLDKTVEASDKTKSYFLNNFSIEELQTLKRRVEIISPEELDKLVNLKNLKGNPLLFGQLQRNLNTCFDYAIKVKENQIKELKTNFGKLMEEVSSDKNVSDELKGIIQKVHDQEKISNDELNTLLDYLNPRLLNSASTSIKDVLFIRTLLRDLSQSPSLTTQEQKETVECYTEDMQTRLTEISKSAVTGVLNDIKGFFGNVFGGNKKEEE